VAAYKEVSNKNGQTGFLVTISIGRDPVTGKNRTLSKRVIGNKTKAEAWAHKTLADRDKGLISTHKNTIGELLNDVEADYKINGKDLKWVQRVIEKHVRPRFGDLRPERLTTTILRNYVMGRQENGAKASTINHALAILRRSFNLGLRSGKVARVPYFPMVKIGDNSRKGFFEQDEYLRLREALPEELQTLATYAFFSGSRKQEILGLRWDQVDWTARCVQLHASDTKNRRPRTIPLTAELFERFTLQKETHDRYWPESPWVFSRCGERIVSFRKAWVAACEKAGVPNKLFHDFRRSAVRNMIRGGASQTGAMAVSGHLTASVFSRYNVTSERDLRQIAESVPLYLDQESKQKVSTRSRHEPISKNVM